VTAPEVVAALARREDALRAYLTRQRWFAGKARGVDRATVEDVAVLDPAGPLLLALVDVDGERYYVPLAVADAAADGDVIVRLGSAVIADAHAEPAFARRLLQVMSAGRDVAGERGRFLGRLLRPGAGPSPAEAASIDARRLSTEQSNTSIALGRDLILKSLRRLRAGINPELEVTRFLAERTSFRSVPPLVGWVDYADAAGDRTTVSVLQGFVDNRGDGWRHVVLALGRALDARVPPSPGASAAACPGSDDSLIGDVRELARVTGQLHVALAADGADPSFAPELVTPEDAERWGAQIARALGRAASDALTAAPNLARALKRGAGALDVRADLGRLVAAGAHKIRCHGDYHLGQVLKTAASFAVIDFEGEPARPLAERREKQSPLRDVAGMLRSFNYAVHTVLREREPAERARAGEWLDTWEREARHAFLGTYADTVAGSPVRLVPPSRGDLRRACAAFEIDKVCYELAYELDNRPDWIAIPLAGLARLLDPAHGGAPAIDPS